eukprot:6329298-Prymnesium_polylepis.1
MEPTRTALASSASASAPAPSSLPRASAQLPPVRNGPHSSQQDVAPQRTPTTAPAANAATL